MKYFLLLIVAVITLSSCEKEETATLYDNGLVKSIEIQAQSTNPSEKFTIKYDDLDRVYSINDTIFYYGLNDKVAYSRFSEVLHKDGHKSEKIVKKSYHWDAKNRLSYINVDSIYQMTASPGGIVSVNNSLPFTEAYFYYSGLQSLPDSIGYAIGAGGTNLIIKRFYHSYGNITKIDELQPVDAADEEQNNSNILKSTFLDYSDESNYLYPLYIKLGFLPKGLGYVTSQKIASTSETIETIIIPTEDGQRKVKRSTVKNTYSTNSGNNGFPSLITTNSMIDFDNGHGYSNAGSTSTYIYY